MAKSDFEKIVAQYAEMMATAASIVPECVDLINNYRKNNYDATTKYIKDICMGKYELQYLLGLGGTQMQTVTVGMAAFLCCGSNDGMLNGGSLEEFVLTKADVMAIASVAYNAVHLDEEQLPLEEIWASCDGDSSNEYDSDDVEQAKRLRQEFEYALFNATYYHYLCKQCRRQSLSNLNNYFFNPQGLKLDAELKKCNRQIERDKALIQSQKEVLESLTVRANVAEKSATEARNRYAAIQSKVESQQSKIDVLQKELSLLRAENEELRHILPAPESPKYAPAKVEPEINYADMLAAIFTNKKIVFIGGHQNIMSKFSQKYPDAVVIPHDKAVLANQPLEAADAVLFKTDSMGHKEYNPIKDLADRRNIPIGYIGDFTSLTLVEKSVYEELTKLGLLQ